MDFFFYLLVVDLGYQFVLVEVGGFFVIVLGIGLVEKYMIEYCGCVLLIFKFNGKINIFSDVEVILLLFVLVEDVVWLGVDVVGYIMYVGLLCQYDEFCQFEQVCCDCECFGMLLVLWLYLCGGVVNVKGGIDMFYVQDYVVCVVLELGVDIVKLYEFNDSVVNVFVLYDKLSEDVVVCCVCVVCLVGCIMVLFFGGEKNDDDVVVLCKVEFYMQFGVSGVMFGCNMWLCFFDQVVVLICQVYEIMQCYLC